ncbi:MAG: OPT/YSL family transporter [Deltaproteobacteria bacterium]|nr:OPT/YSL family transporter [Deltaproteobacteria bacterium]
MNSPRYHLLLGFVAIFVLGPLGGVTAAYMNFSLGFFVGGQVLAGILGSAVTAGYGAEGKHGANYMQTMAASVAGMSGMAVLIQAMVWLGLPPPPAWQLILYFMSIGMFGVGAGMLYTPILVDKMQLTFPSGLAVANILRALTDVRLLRRSIGKLGTGTLIGFVGGQATGRLGALGGLSLSTATIGAGMVVGARITVPAVMVGLLGEELLPWLREMGWLGANDPFRKFGFVVALGTILGAAIVDLSIIFRQAIGELGKPKAPVAEGEEWKQTNTTALIGWVVFWGLAVAGIAVGLFGLPPLFVGIAIGLVFLFLVVNGISTGISDSNPISSAFVVSVFVMAAAGLTDPATGLMCASILLIATSVGVDMQQDRSTGWRLGTSRVVQFRYQVIGIVMGAILSIGFAKLFMTAYPILELNQFASTDIPAEASAWQSAMTFKFVGALDGLTHPKSWTMPALGVGIAIGLVLELIRKVVRAIPAYRDWVVRSRGGYAFDFCFDCFLVPSPYAASFGGFVDFMTSVWFSVGGVLSSFATTLEEEAVRPWKERAAASGVSAPEDDVPEDMSTTGLVGGGLIAGDSLAALALGLQGLVTAMFRH